MEVTPDTGEAKVEAPRPRGRRRTPATPAAGRSGGSDVVEAAPASPTTPIVVPNTLWQAADPTAYGGGRPPTITHLAELELEDKGDKARWGALDVLSLIHI